MEELEAVFSAKGKGKAEDKGKGRAEDKGKDKAEDRQGQAQGAEDVFGLRALSLINSKAWPWCTFR
jgi:hypothetical protein